MFLQFQRKQDNLLVVNLSTLHDLKAVTLSSHPG